MAASGSSATGQRLVPQRLTDRQSGEPGARPCPWYGRSSLPERGSPPSRTRLTAPVHRAHPVVSRPLHYPLCRRAGLRAMNQAMRSRSEANSWVSWPTSGRRASARSFDPLVIGGQRAIEANTWTPPSSTAATVGTRMSATSLERTRQFLRRRPLPAPSSSALTERAVTARPNFCTHGTHISPNLGVPARAQRPASESRRRPRRFQVIRGQLQHIWGGWHIPRANVMHRASGKRAGAAVGRPMTWDSRVLRPAPSMAGRKGTSLPGPVR